MSGHSFASFLLGAVDSAEYNGLFCSTRQSLPVLGHIRSGQLEGHTLLTLNLGVRWEHYAPRREHNDNFSSFDPTIPNPGAGNRLGAVGFPGNGPGRDSNRESFADSYWKTFAPRFGFAYQLTSRTVLRGGYGLFYGAGNATQGLRGSQTLSMVSTRLPRTQVSIPA